MEKELIDRFNKAGQGHVFEGFYQLTENQQMRLIEQTMQFDLSEVSQLASKLNLDSSKSKELKQNDTFEALEPEIITYKEDMRSNRGAERKRLIQLGHERIKQGKVTAVILAGGQGTRLGFDHPKGMFQIGLPSGKSLFQVLVERFFKAQFNAHGVIPTAWSVPFIDGVSQIPDKVQTCKLMIMTSPENHEETVQFFKDKSYFGGLPSSFVFFQQQMMPAVDDQGNIIMKSSG